MSSISTESAGCQRFEQLALARTQAELSADDQGFIEAHLGECAACREVAATERALARTMTDGPGTPADEMAYRRWLDSLVEASLNGPDLDALPDAEPRRRWLLVAAGTAIAAGLVLALWLGGPWSADTAGQGRGGGTPASQPRIVSTVGDVLRDGKPATDGEPIGAGKVLETGAGQTVLEVPGRAKLVVKEHSRVRAVSLSGEELQVSLERGQVLAEVQPLPADHRFVVQTGFGRVEVVGTVFSVTLGLSSAEVVVQQGSVRVFEPGQPTRTVKAGGSTVLRGHAAAMAAAPAAPSAPRPGKAAAEAGQRSAVSRAPVVLRAEPIRSASERLAEARQLRMREEWQAAAQEYQALVRAFPDGPEAGAALVALGQIQLEYLIRPDDALASFGAYLAQWPQGSLAVEAAYGRLSALRALGREADEQRALQAFLERYPRSVQARMVRQRLRELGQ